jgi:hypothetical protein
MCLTDVLTACGTEQVPDPIRITHPFHPQRGEEIEVVMRRLHFGEDRVFFRSAQGHVASLPARWTSLVPEDPVEITTGERARFRVGDLIELAALVSRVGS